ncbi:unc-50 protein [Phytophthora nicotianae]|uniref:Unc-50 protein n=1 Tax=Phytophthora nicotianae TaxID=4792 RepID=A0A0W8DY37_PHYNI|nr:unc-50 protein [Phytophthora nicotianae]
MQAVTNQQTIPCYPPFAIAPGAASKRTGLNVFVISWEDVLAPMSFLATRIGLQPTRSSLEAAKAAYVQDRYLQQALASVEEETIEFLRIAATLGPVFIVTEKSVRYMETTCVAFFPRLAHWLASAVLAMDTTQQFRVRVLAASQKFANILESSAWLARMYQQIVKIAVCEVHGISIANAGALIHAQKLLQYRESGTLGLSWCRSPPSSSVAMLSPATHSKELLQPSTSIDMKYMLSSDPLGSRQKKKAKRAGTDVFRSCSAFPEYFARVLDYRQMDLDATFYQMVTLCVQPAKVYKSAYYRKQTKNRWARDDPAFAVIQFAFLLVATVAWAIAFRVDSAAKYASLLFHAVVIEWLGCGLVISTLCWWIANHHLRQRNNLGVGDALYVEQRVEWQFAFDIHCNSFFILFLFLYVLQFLLAPLLASNSFVMLLVGNLLYSLGWGFYTYITFLGYMGTLDASLVLAMVLILTYCFMLASNSAPFPAPDGAVTAASYRNPCTLHIHVGVAGSVRRTDQLCAPFDTLLLCSITVVIPVQYSRQRAIDVSSTPTRDVAYFEYGKYL